MFYSHLTNPNKQRIDAMFNTCLSKSEEEQLLCKAYEGINGLTKADELGILSFDGVTDIEKGRIAMPIGSHANWGGIDYLKTASGWKPAGKFRGHVKANHDHIHNNEEADKDHHEMTMDAGKMDHAAWTAKHGSNLHAKYKDVHDYLHKEKAVKKVGEVKFHTDIMATNTIDLIKEGASKGVKEVKVKFNSAYDEKLHSNLKENLKDTLKKQKEETFDIISEASEVINLLKNNKDVESITWAAPVETKEAHAARGFDDKKGDEDVTGKDAPLPFEDGADKHMQGLKDKEVTKVPTEDEANKIKADAMIKPSFEEYQNATPEKRTQMLDKLNKNFADNEAGKKTGSGADKHIVEAGKKLLEMVNKFDQENKKPEPVVAVEEAKTPSLKDAFKEKYGVDGSTLLHAINTQFPGNTRLNQETKINEVAKKMGVEGKFSNDEMLISMLEGDLSKIGKLGKGDMIHDAAYLHEGTVIKTQPIAGKSNKPTDAFDSMKDIVNDDDLRPAMSGVYHDVEAQVLVATDAHVLTVLPQKLEGENKIVDFKTKKVIDARFPDYKVVIPQNNIIHHNVNVSDLRTQLNGLNAANKLFDTRGNEMGIAASVQTPFGNTYFNPGKLTQALSFFEKNGVKDVTMELNVKATTGAIFRSKSNPGMMALVMPVQEGNSPFVQELNVGKGNINGDYKANMMDTYHKREYDKAVKKKDDWGMKYHKPKLDEEMAEHEKVKKIIKDSYNTNEDFSHFKTMPVKQVEKYRDVAQTQLSQLGKEHGMKQMDVDKYPEHIKRAYDQLNERIKQADLHLNKRA